MDIAGKTALVTGAAAGIGRMIALRLAREGAAVLVVDVDAEEGARTVEEVRSEGGQAAFFHADVTKDAEVEAAIDHAERAFGTLDILVNNAGGFREPVFLDAP